MELSNKEAIKWLVSIKKSISGGDEEFDNRRKKSIDMAIKALEDSRWILVTERLPDEGERVLATHLGGLDPNRQVIEHTYENRKFVDGWYMDMNMDSPTFGQRYMGDVVAWMPLPTPYEVATKLQVSCKERSEEE